MPAASLPATPHPFTPPPLGALPLPAHCPTDQGQAVAYRGMVDCFVRTVREEGLGALFKGLAPNYVKVVPSIAIAFVTYEQVGGAGGGQGRVFGRAGGCGRGVGGGGVALRRRGHQQRCTGPCWCGGPSLGPWRPPMCQPNEHTRLPSPAVLCLQVKEVLGAEIRLSD